MDELQRLGLARFFARKMLNMRNVIDGISMIQAGELLSTEDLVVVGRDALDLIESGEVS
jgi:hypothetical protein